MNWTQKNIETYAFGWRGMFDKPIRKIKCAGHMSNLAESLKTRYESRRGLRRAALHKYANEFPSSLSTLNQGSRIRTRIGKLEGPEKKLSAQRIMISYANR